MEKPMSARKRSLKFLGLLPEINVADIEREILAAESDAQLEGRHEGMEEALKIIETYHAGQPGHGSRCFCALAAGLVQVAAVIRKAGEALK